MAQMQDLLAKSFRDFREGSIVKGRVLEIRPREVLVDIGYKSEGVIPSAEFDNIDTWRSAMKWTCCSSVLKTMRAWSCFPKRRPLIARIGTKSPASFRATV